MRTSKPSAAVSLFLTTSLLGCGGDVTNSRSESATGGAADGTPLTGGASDKIGGYPGTGGTSVITSSGGVAGGPAAGGAYGELGGAPNGSSVGGGEPTGGIPSITGGTSGVGITGGRTSVTGGSSGVTGGSGAQSTSGGSGGQASTRASCIDVSLSEANVTAYTGSALLTVERTGAVDPSYFWSPVVTIAVAGGTQQPCTSSTVISPSSRFTVVECQGLSLGACGTNVTIQVTLGANGYSFATGNTSPACESSKMTLTYTVPVKCPTCPSSSTPGPFSGPCDMAPGTTCSYQTTLYHGGVGGNPSVSLPCLCNFDTATGARGWSCTIS